MKIRAFGSLLGLLGAIGLSPPSLAEQPIRIGASMSITGKAYSVQGGYGRKGYRLCEKDVNHEAESLDGQ
jgi:hypothetical protein